MTRTSNFAPGFFLASLVALTVSFAPPAYGGVLNGHSGAVTFSAFTGTGSFSSGTLSGDLDYAVFTSSEFATAFPSAAAPLGPVVYAYQLKNANSAAISTEIIGVSNLVSGDIDSFANVAGEVNPSSEFFDSGNPTWLFSAPNLLDTEVSEILWFSSPNTPMLGVSLTINGGTSAVTVDVPTPSATAIPEPASVCLAAAGVMAMLIFRRKRRM